MYVRSNCRHNSAASFSGVSFSSWSTTTFRNKFVLIRSHCHPRFKLIACPYTGNVKCAICGIRKPRRFCPGVSGDICTLCCGTGRENTIDCPLTCEYLLEAHRHEKIAEVNPATLPNGDIRISEEFLAQNEMLLAYVGSALFEAALQKPGTNDLDLRTALDSLVQTYRALESGLYYEARPQNPIAAEIAAQVQERIATVRKKEEETRGGVSTIRDAALLGVLAFLQRLEYMNNNGRPKSKAFLDFLGRFALAPVVSATEASAEETAQPDEPRVIL